MTSSDTPNGSGHAPYRARILANFRPGVTASSGKRRDPILWLPGQRRKCPLGGENMDHTFKGWTQRQNAREVKPPSGQLRTPLPGTGS